jgi:D-3-phosphoglycerate dehydrogenase
MTEPFSMVITSDRYSAGVGGLETERQIIAEFPDLNATIRGEMGQTEDELAAIGQTADALLVSTRDVISRSLMQRIPRVKVIAIYGVGLNNVDLDAAADLGIVITHFPQYCTAEVADHAMALLLSMNRRIVQQNALLHEGEWVRHRAQTGSILRGEVPALRESTLGIIGLGRIGRATAQRAKGFGMRLIASDPLPDEAVARELGVDYVTLDYLLAQSDLITIHCPLTPQTHHLIDQAALAKTKTDVVIVNTARGPIIDLDALVADLSANPTKRAALDVTDPEPLPLDHPLYAMENVILTPHSAYYSERSVQVVRRETLVEACTVLRGYVPRVLENPAVLDRISLKPQPQAG